jgi:hypothetical protein
MEAFNLIFHGFKKFIEFRMEIGREMFETVIRRKRMDHFFGTQSEKRDQKL